MKVKFIKFYRKRIIIMRSMLHPFVSRGRDKMKRRWFHFSALQDFLWKWFVQYFQVKEVHHIENADKVCYFASHIFETKVVMYWEINQIFLFHSLWLIKHNLKARSIAITIGMNTHLVLQSSHHKIHPRDTHGKHRKIVREEICLYSCGLYVWFVIVSSLVWRNWNSLTSWCC